MNNKDFKDYIKKVNNNICNIYTAFYLSKNIIENSKFTNIYERYPYFWGMILSSLSSKYLLGIAKLFEESKKNKEEVISIPFLLEFIPEEKDKEKIKKEIDNQKPVLKNIKKWRNKILAHQDRIVSDNIKDFNKKYKVKFAQIENLFSSIEKILRIIQPKIYNDFSLIKNGCKRESDNIIGKLSEDLYVLWFFS